MSDFDYRQFFLEYWQPICAAAAVFLLALFCLAFRLNTLLPGYSHTELNTLAQSTSLKNILHNPLNAPFKLVGRLAFGIHPHGTILYLRRTSALIGLITFLLLGWTLYVWHNIRTAIFGTLVFSSSAWFLHVSRLATPEILMFSVFILFALGICTIISKSQVLIVTIIVLSALMFYIPGMIWFVGLLLTLNWKSLDKVFKRNLNAVSLGGVIAVIALAPLVYSAYLKPSILNEIINFPANGWPNLFTVAHNIGDVPLRIFAYGHFDPVTWLDHMPLLSIFCSAMFILGCYHYVDSNRGRLFQLLIIILFGSVFISLGGSATLTVLVPFIFLLVAVGIEFVLEQWYSIFPRNPIAQSVGLSVLSLVVLLNVLYQTREYFIAWPHNPETQSLFTVAESGVKSINSGTIKG